MPSRPSRLLAAAALIASGLTAGALTVGPAGVAAEPSAPASAPFTLWAPDRVVAIKSERRSRAWVELTVRAVGGADDFEIRSHRASYDEPITTTWTLGSASGTLPVGIQGSFSGLDRFLTTVYRDVRTGEVAARRRLSACLNLGGERVRPDAAPRSPYPLGCPYHPFTVGSVQGLQAGWATPLSYDYRPIRIERGRYDATTTISPGWATALGFSADQRSVTTRVVVKEVRTGDHAHARRAGVDAAGDVARPAARRPVGGSSVAAPQGPRPDLRSLPAFGIQLNRTGSHLRFSATVWNAGDSPLVVDGFRRDGEDVMDAYQYFFDGDGEQVGYQQVGELRYHGTNHQHWHFQDFARYRLLRMDRTEAARSGKVSFCLANTDAVDLTVPGADWRPDSTDLTTACGEPGSLSVREVLASGSGDTYAQFRAGQAIKVEHLPNGWYLLAVEANPDGRLVESDTANNVSLRQVRLAGRPGRRRVVVPQVGVIDETTAGYYGW